MRNILIVAKGNIFIKYLKHKLRLLCVIWFPITAREPRIPGIGSFLRCPWPVLGSRKESGVPCSPCLVAIWGCIREQGKKYTSSASVCIIYLLHVLSRHGLEVGGMTVNWKMSEWVKWSWGEVGKRVGPAAFRLRIVRGGRKWVLAMTGNAIGQLGIPGSKFYAIQDDHDMAKGLYPRAAE